MNFVPARPVRLLSASTAAASWELVLALSPVFQVEPEARRSGAQSQLPTSIEIVSEGKGAWQRGTAEVCPLTHFFPLPSASCSLLVQLPPEIKWLPCRCLGAWEVGRILFRNSSALGCAWVVLIWCGSCLPFPNALYLENPNVVRDLWWEHLV